jgi:hypothetical protein
MPVYVKVIETSERFYLVMEYARAGELFDYIVAKDRLKVLTFSSSRRPHCSSLKVSHDANVGG